MRFPIALSLGGIKSSVLGRFNHLKVLSWTLLLLGLSLEVAPNPLLAYSEASAFSRDPSEDTTGGGGNIYFTGSPRSHGLSCLVCHVDGPKDIGLQLSALENNQASSLFESGYIPGTIYEIEVAFESDHLAPFGGCAESEDEPCNINTFALEILDQIARPAGQLCPIQPSQTLFGSGDCAGCANQSYGGILAKQNCSLVIADAFDASGFRWHNGVIAYSFFWTAPMEDTGPLTLYVAGVDGRGIEKEDGEVTSYQNDGVVALQVELSSPEGTADSPQPLSCTNTSSDFALAIGAGLAVLLFTRRKRILTVGDQGSSRLVV